MKKRPLTKYPNKHHNFLFLGNINYGDSNDTSRLRCY